LILWGSFGQPFSFSYFLGAKTCFNFPPFAVVKKKKVGLFFSKRKIYHPPAQQCNHVKVESDCFPLLFLGFRKAI
jgi:hypothetical protein